MNEFKVEVTDMVEHEDGSATVTFDTCERGRKSLISYGLLKILETAASESLALEGEEENED